MAKGKQTEIKGDGFERKTVKAVETAAEEYVELRDKRMALGRKEVEAKTKLLHEMTEHKLSIYRYDGKTVEVLPSEKVKVRADADEEPQDD